MKLVRLSTSASPSRRAASPLLEVRHAGVGDRLVGGGDALDEAGVLGREQALGDQQEQDHGKRQGQGRHHQRQPLAVEDQLSPWS